VIKDVLWGRSRIPKTTFDLYNTGAVVLRLKIITSSCRSEKSG
jgi:hypothetical protein